MLVHLRTQLPRPAPAELYGVARSTLTEAIGELRPLLGDRGFAVPDRPGLRLRTLADVFAHAAAESVKLRIDGTETRVPCPRAHRPGRCAFLSGKKKQNTVKTTTISDGQGRTLWSGADRPGRTHDQTAMRTVGIAEQFPLHPRAMAEADESCRGPAKEFPEQVSARPKKPKGEDASLGEQYASREMRRRRPSARICVEHANAEHRQWRPLRRFLGRREYYAATHRAVAGPVSDRASQRATRRRPSTEPVSVSSMAC
ncbi:transposase family protein [Streptomyces sp. NPDC058695]|uniref:transposase family protein n=1 Tax=Streptomyces sp. NPDC058695 TaxID=3346604 RepID=UPI00365791EE